MTVCIAGVAEDGKKAILIADKLVTNKGILPYQTDMAADKILKINNNVYALYCGGITDAHTIIERSVKSIADNKFVYDVARFINDKHLEYLQEILIRAHLTTRGIKDINEFYQEYFLKFDEVTRRSIDEALTTHNLTSNTQFIVCGKESDGKYKIYYLGNNPRSLPLLMTNGYSSIGSGANYSECSIIQSKYNKSCSIEEAEIIFKAAKKAAESDRDVGASEDVVIMD